MRLSPESCHIIRKTTAEIFGPEAEVRLFGSRIDDEARGGDIDLLVVSEQPVEDKARKSLALVARLQMRLGDQPIDVLVIDPATEIGAVHAQALREGVAV
jgi:predicted nucleotidyltransferase